MVHEPSHPRGNALGRASPARWAARASIVEADETYYGPVDERRPSMQRGDRPYTKGGQFWPGGKRAIVSLVERGGNVRSFHVAVADGETVSKIVRENIARESRLHTDESKLYVKAGAEFTAHETVNHTARSTPAATCIPTPPRGISRSSSVACAASTSTAARSTCTAIWPSTTSGTIIGPGWATSDAQRTAAMVKGAAGKRLTYQQPHAPECRYVVTRLLRMLMKHRKAKA